MRLASKWAIPASLVVVCGSVVMLLLLVPGETDLDEQTSTVPQAFSHPEEVAWARAAPEEVADQLARTGLTAAEIRARLVSAGLGPDVLGLDRVDEVGTPAHELTGDELLRVRLAETGLSPDQIRYRLTSSGLPAEALDHLLDSR